MYNHVTLVGRMTKDPDIAYTKDGIAVSNFTLAVQRAYKKNGEYEADFIPCTVWRKQAESTAAFCHKGALVAIGGRIQTRTYEKQSGEKQFVVEVVVDQIRFLKTNPPVTKQEPSAALPTHT